MGGRIRNRGGPGGGAGGRGYSGGGGLGSHAFGNDNYRSNDNFGPVPGNFGRGPNINNGNGFLPNNVDPNEIVQMMSAALANASFNMQANSPNPVRLGCGEIRARHNGLLVEMTGRLIKKRVSRFAELRDRSGGAAQLVILEDKFPRIARRFSNMPGDTFLTIIGVCMLRPKNSCNQTMPTGEVEVEVQDIVRIDFPSNHRKAQKRPYSTMTQPNQCGITSTEYKIAKTENLLKYFENRDTTCNDLRPCDIGRTVTLVGWLPNSSNSKFQQLKDGYGQTQVIVENATLQQTFSSAPEQTLVQVTGKVVARPKNNINMKYDTGEIEVIVEKAKVINPEEPYDGPIRQKPRVEKMSIDDLDAEEQAVNENGSATKNGVAENVPAVAETTKVADLCKFADRTHTCGELTSANINEKVVLCGWLEFQRMNKFLILRDSYGQTQVLLTDKVTGLELDTNDLTLETILRVEGTVIPRPTPTINDKMKTGEIEIDASKIELLNRAKKNLPFEVRNFNRAGEHLRLSHRYIDLRFTDMQRNLRTRSSVIMKMREYLINYLGFVEVETPTLFRRTPGGAQEFVVPTRMAGKFYSLVQSPQQFKQMLMAGAIDRYFQIARCYRDEATRPDRQPEFTQLDIELSFTNRDDIMQLIEETLRYCWPKEFPKIKLPFERISYADAMEKYGTDKPDTRYDMQLKNMTAIVEQSETLKEKYTELAAYAIVVRRAIQHWNNAARKHYDDLGKNSNCNLFVRKFQNHKDLVDRLSNICGAEAAQALADELSLKAEDILFLGIGNKLNAQTLLGRIRNDYQNFLIENKKVPRYVSNNFIWVIDFPMFAKNPDTNALESVHHPFTAPHADDMEAFNSSKHEDLVNIRSQAYDLVLNGQEIGGGSMRIHNRDMQHFVLEQILQIPHEHLTHLLSALESGCPPHGGIALGLDRLIAIICRAANIRDVIAFPKSLNGRDPLSNAPVEISEEEKQLYHLETLDGDIKEDEQEEEQDIKAEEEEEEEKIASDVEMLDATDLKQEKTEMLENMPSPNKKPIRAASKK